MKTIIFVCHGNICRSVAAEYIAKDYVHKNNKDNEYRIYSRATSKEEIGNDIYPPMKSVLSEHNIPFKHHYAEQITKSDYELADYIFYMDQYNKSNLDRMFDDYKYIVKPISLYDKNIKDIEDPWYSDNFDKVINELIICVKEIFDNLWTRNY